MISIDFLSSLTQGYPIHSRDVTLNMNVADLDDLLTGVFRVKQFLHH
jgi:hypothetical protein